MADEPSGSGESAHSALCLRLMQVFPRVIRGMRRWQDGAAPQAPAPLGPRHVAALHQLRGGPVTVGELASRLGLALPTVSGVLADLDRAVTCGPDPGKQRPRTPGQRRNAPPARDIAASGAFSQRVAGVGFEPT
jgi:hypothetical protein